GLYLVEVVQLAALLAIEAVAAVRLGALLEPLERLLAEHLDADLLLQDGRVLHLRRGLAVVALLLLVPGLVLGAAAAAAAEAEAAAGAAAAEEEDRHQPARRHGAQQAQRP